MKLYDAELQELADIGAMYEEHLRQSTEYLSQDREAIEALGAVISEQDGSILNYDALMAAHVDAYNAAVDAYNAGSITEEGFKNAEEQYQKFQELLKQYEETLSLHEEDIDKYVNNILQRYDLMAEKNAEALELRIDYDDSVLDFLDRLIDRLDSWNGSMFKGVDTLGLLNQKTGELLDKNEDLYKGIDSVLEHFLKDYKEFDEYGNLSFATGLDETAIRELIERYKANALTQEDIELLAHLPAAEAEALQNFAQQLEENADALIATANEVVQTIGDTFAAIKEEMENAAKPIEWAAEALENYTNIIDIVGQDYLGITDELAEFLDQSTIDVAHQATLAAKETMDTLANQRDQVQELYQQAVADGNMEMAELLRQQLNDCNDMVQEATENFHQKWQEELRAARESFEKTVDRIRDNMLDAFAGPNNTWREFKESFDYAKEVADRFVPEYKEIYELSKLNRDINKSIDDTDNIKNKQALRELQQEINRLEEHSGEISQYDLDNARRRYELELARLALEEARTMKDTVRLSKDAEGNWSYIYTANEEDVADAEQNYEDKLYAMQEANSDYINNLQDQIVSAEEEYADKVAEIMKDTSLTQEQRDNLMALAYQQFQERVAYYSGELEKAIGNNKDLYENDWAWYADYTARKAAQESQFTDDYKTHLGYRLGDIENFVTDFNDLMLATETGYNTIEDFNEQILLSTEEYTGLMIDAWTRWDENTRRAMEGAGTSVDTFATDMEDQITHVIIPSAEAAAGAVSQLGSTADQEFKEMMELVQQWYIKYHEQLSAAVGDADAVATSISHVTDYVTDLDGSTIHIGWDIAEPHLPELPSQITIPIHYDTSGGASSSSSQGGNQQQQGGNQQQQGGNQQQQGGGSSKPTILSTSGWKYDGSYHWKTNLMSDHTEQITQKARHNIQQYGVGLPSCTICGYTPPSGSSSGSGGCFAAGTKILMADGSTKNIEEIKLGEEVMSYSTEANIMEAKPVLGFFFKIGYNELIRLYASNNTITDMTPGHPLYTNKGWQSLDIEMSMKEHSVEVTLLDENSIIKGYDGDIEIIDIQKFTTSSNYVVYCLSVADNNTFIANGMLVHNKMDETSAAKFASGGYTGDFGPDGKLAVLHSKELVLNQEDTKNMLSAIDMVRSFSNTIEAYAHTAQFSLGNISTAAYLNNASSGSLDQTVHITAEFPGVTSRNEIEAAFETLINEASQYANRKNI